MPRPRKFTEEDKRWVLSQEGASPDIAKLSQQRGAPVSATTVKRFRKEAAGRESAYAGSVKKTTLADRESPGTEDEIIVQQSSMITDPDALPSIETLQKTQASTLPLLDPPVSATPGGSMDKDHQGSLIAQVSLGKRKRLTKSTDAMSCRSDNSGSDPQLTDSDSGPDVSITTAAARSLLRGRDCLNSTHVNGLLELFGGCDVQTYHIDEFRSSEEVSCAGQSSEYDGDIRTILNLTYEILGIPMPNYVDIAWWRSVLSSIWEGQTMATSRLSNESGWDDAVDYEESSLLSQGVLRDCPTAKTIIKEQLTNARKAVRQGLISWSASCKRDKEDAALLRRLKNAQEDSQTKIHAISKELELIEQLLQLAESLNQNKHLVNVGDSKEKAKILHEDLTSTKSAAQISAEKFVQLRSDISTRTEEVTSLRIEVGKHLVRLDAVTEATLELSQTASMENPRFTTFNLLSGPRPNDRPRHDTAQDTRNVHVGSLSPEQQVKLKDVAAALKNAKTIVALVGAGISTAAGIPDFRSKDGMFKSLKKKYKLKGPDLFHASVYLTEERTTTFHEMVRNLSIKCREAKPTEFHRMLGVLAEEGRLLRLMSQNIDGLDTAIPSLATKVPLTPPYPTTIQLHGSIEWMLCISCLHTEKLDPDMFNGPSMSPCAACDARDTDRMRAAKGGGMRPRFTLYGEHGNDDDAIEEVLASDLKKRYRMCIVAGTALKGITSVQKTVRDMSTRVDLMVWINKDPPPKLKNVTWHLTFQGLCDDVARAFLDSYSQSGVQSVVSRA